MPRIAFRVCGAHPVGYEAPKNPGIDIWCKAIADVASHYEKKVYAVTSSTEFTLCLSFYVVNGKQGLSDLAKPVIDTLFQPRTSNENRTAPVGIMFEGMNETKITSLTLRKREVESFREQGVDVIVAWE